MTEEMQPAGWQPPGWQPTEDGGEVAGGAIAFLLDGCSVLLKHPGAELTYRIFVPDWLIPEGATIESAALEAAGLTFGEATPDNETVPKSVVVQIGGGSHARSYQARVALGYSEGGTLVRTLPVRAFAS